MCICSSKLRALKILEKSKETIKYVFSATNYDFPIQKYFTIDKKGFFQKRKSIFYQKRTQDSRETFHDAGQFYWGTKNAWLEEKPIFSNDSVPIVIPEYRVQDIDTEDDWIRAELIFKSSLPI